MFEAVRLPVLTPILLGTGRRVRQTSRRLWRRGRRSGAAPVTIVVGSGTLAVGVVLAGSLVSLAVRATSALLEPVRSGKPSSLRSIVAPAQSMGLTLADVDIPGELGILPAWKISASPADSSQGKDSPSHTWVILVHGQGGDRRDCLGASATFDALGLTQLVISWRNDGVAGPSPDALYHLGDSEWLDLESSVEWALANGARRIVLYGFSMGGSITATFLERSVLAPRVIAVVLDAPVLDWRAVLRHGARRRYVPSVLARITARVAQRRVGIDFDDLDHLRLALGTELPTLIIHGTEDGLVPLGTSRLYAHEHPLTTTLFAVQGARHGDTWRSDARACHDALHRFLLPIVGTPVEVS